MELPPDELAGVVDVVGPLTPDELGQACTELAFKRGEPADAEQFDGDIETAVASYHLVRVTDHDTETTDPLVVVGPTAFPVVPPGGDDLPHILDVPDRSIPRTERVEAAESRFRADAARAVEAGDEDRITALLDVSYDLETWGPVELATARARLDDA